VCGAGTPWIVRVRTVEGTSRRQAVLEHSEDPYHCHLLPLVWGGSFRSVWR
jgi:hypothetical protein